jgi:serine/threonine protein kinase
MSLKGLKDWKQLELFQREAAVLQSLAHPNIPKCAAAT